MVLLIAIVLALKANSSPTSGCTHLLRVTDRDDMILSYDTVKVVSKQDFRLGCLKYLLLSPVLWDHWGEWSTTWRPEDLPYYRYLYGIRLHLCRTSSFSAFRRITVTTMPATGIIIRGDSYFFSRFVVFEGAFRAWSHLGGLDPATLETKPANKKDPVDFPFLHDPRNETNPEEAERRKFSYEPLPRSGHSHPFMKAILAQWLVGISPDKQTLQTFETCHQTLRVWWQHRRRGPSKIGLRTLRTVEVRIMVDVYTRHFLELMHPLLVSGKVQPPLTLRRKMRQLQQPRCETTGGAKALSTSVVHGVPVNPSDPRLSPLETKSHDAQKHHLEENAALGNTSPGISDAKGPGAHDQVAQGMIGCTAVVNEDSTASLRCKLLAAFRRYGGEFRVQSGFKAPILNTSDYDLLCWYAHRNQHLPELIAAATTSGEDASIKVVPRLFKISSEAAPKDIFRGLLALGARVGCHDVAPLPDQPPPKKQKTEPFEAELRDVGPGRTPNIHDGGSAA